MHCDHVTMRHNLHIEPVFEKREVCVMFAKKIGDQPVVVERDNQALGRWKG